jgi:hypothetical protein
MSLVANVQDPWELQSESAASDVLIMGAAELFPPPETCRSLMREFPDLKLLVLASSGDAAELYWLGLRRQRLPGVSPLALLNAIRRIHTLDSSA